MKYLRTKIGENWEIRYLGLNFHIQEVDTSLEQTMKGIRGVTFDFGGTLAQGELDKNRFTDRLLVYLRSLGFSGREAQLRQARNGMLERLMRARARNREIRLEDLYQGVLFEIGIHPEPDVIDHIHQLYIGSFEVELVPGVGEVLEFLSAEYRLAVVSNAISDVPRYALKRFDLEKYLNTVTISRDIGIRKPDPEIFRFTLANLAIESNKAIHVGDSLEDDIQGARNVGMRTIWIANSDEEISIQPDYTIYSLAELTSLLR